jgi:hypothetical protein
MAQKTRTLATVLAAVTLGLLVTAAPAAAADVPNGPIHCCVD